MIPKKINTGAFIVKVEEIESLITENGTELSGRFISDDCLIILEKKQRSDKKEETFLHELFHLCLDEAGLVPGMVMEEELAVNMMSISFHRMLKLNPSLRKFLGSVR